MYTNVLSCKHGSINVEALESKMKIYVDISQYWPQNLSLNAVYEELLLQGRKIDRRTLSGAKAGTLTKSEFVTLVKLRDWLRERTNNPDLKIDDLLMQKPD